MSNPFAFWYWSDYDRDAGLRVCSPGAQGLWMRLLCIAAQHDPPGYVAINGKPLDAAAIARMVGWPEDEAKAELAELERNGVFSRDKRKCIYSRRIVRDENRRRIARENGKMGGNPALLASNGKTTRNGSEVNPRHNPRDKTTHKVHARGRDRDPETIYQNPPYSPPATSGPAKLGGLGRMSLTSVSYIDEDGKYRISPQRRAELQARLDAEAAAAAAPPPDPPEPPPAEDPPP